MQEIKIDKKLIEQISSVARLKLSEDEIREFLPQLKEILDSFSKISEVDTEKTEPSFQPVKINDSLREDIAEDCLSLEDALSQTTHKKDGFFMGPKAV